MSNVQLDFPISAETVPQSLLRETASDTSVQIRESLNAFDGERSLKHLFWELLSYDRVREPVPLYLLPPSSCSFLTSIEVFAETAACAIILAKVKYCPDGGRLEQMIWAVHRHIGNCIVLLNEKSIWSIIYPDESLKPRVRILPLPGPMNRRDEITQALCALNAADESSGEEFTAFELGENLDEFFPGATPNIGDLLTDFERIAQHPDEEMRGLWHFIHMAGQYPLLTPAQERGEDLTGNEVTPDGSNLNYQEWRLVVHNLRLVVWMARKIPRVGLDLADIVQEGCTGLITAAKRFDPDLGFRFTTYAYHWVHQAQFRALYFQCNMMRWPVFRAPALIAAALQGHEKGLKAGEMAPVSLHWGVSRRLCNLSFFQLDPITSLVRQQAQSALFEVLAQLKPQEREVIERRFGIGGGEEETLDSIGQDFCLTSAVTA